MLPTLPTNIITENSSIVFAYTLHLPPHFNISLNFEITLNLEKSHRIMRTSRVYFLSLPFG